LIFLWLKKSSIGNNKYWLLIEDKYTSMKWSFFVNRKPKAGKIIIELIKSRRNKDPDFGKFLRLDNSGENQAMVANMKKEELKILIKFTAPHTPEQNGKVCEDQGRLKASINFRNTFTSFVKIIDRTLCKSCIWNLCHCSLHKIPGFIFVSPRNGHIL
jgi:hypothetical protein